jgi:TetR/AcrR family transcriptional regulator, cholesterol catabolism regulator
MGVKSGQIIEQVATLFMRCGIKSVTMDDVARGLSISKKTLYLYFKDRKELVKKVMKYDMEREKTIISGIIEQQENAIDELIEINKHVSKRLQSVHPSIHYDLEKYYPDAWKIFLEYKVSFIYSCVKQNLEKGIKQGLYRKNLNTSIIAKIYVSRIYALFDPIVFPVSEYKFSEVHAEMLRYHIRGIASEKGIKYLVEKVKKENLNLF